MISPETIDARGLRASMWFLQRGVLLTKWTGVMTLRSLSEGRQAIMAALPRPNLIEVADCRSALWAMSPSGLVDAAQRGEVCRVPVAVVVNDGQLKLAHESARQLCLAGYTLRAFTSDLQALVWADGRLRAHHEEGRDPRRHAAGAESPGPSA